MPKTGLRDAANGMADNLDGSNRELMPLRNREVLFFDRLLSCTPYEESKKDIKLKGHYERVDKVATKYFYVDSEKPSGIKDAFVISEKESKDMIVPP